MKVCPKCSESYSAFVDFCFADGEVLAVEVVALAAPASDAFDAPPPPKMLQGATQGGGYTRSATPVPRARRPGRGVVGGAGVYTPPSETPVPAAEATGPATPTPAPNNARQGVPSAWDEEELEAFDAAPVPEFPEPLPEPIHTDTPLRAPTPTPAPRVRVEAAPTRNIDPSVEEEEEEEAKGGMLALGALFIAGLVMVGMLGALVFMVVYSGDPTSTPSDQPLQIGVKPTEPVEPVPPMVASDEPEPTALPEPTEAIEPTEVPPPDPVLPDPVLPVPDPVPAEPAPVPDPGEGVAVVEPAPPSKLATVNINSSPTGAEILIDGTSVATTPFIMANITFGKHKLVMKKEGYETHSSTFEVSSSRMQLPPVRLIPLAGTQPIPAPPQPTEPAPEPDVVVPVPAEPTGPPEMRSVMIFADAATRISFAGGSLTPPQSASVPVGSTGFQIDWTDGTRSSTRCQVPSMASDESLQKFVITKEGGCKSRQ